MKLSKTGTSSWRAAKWSASALAISAGLGLASPGWAQEPAQLEEIVVTAERHTADLQKTAASVSVRGGEELEAQGRFTLADILENVPGVSGGAEGGLSNSGSDTPSQGVIIRGIVPNGGGTGQNLSSVSATAVYVDDVYDGIGGGYDIDRIEILRGPQGTLYGRSATAGVVAIQTRGPDLKEFGADLLAEVGNYGLRHATGAVNLPIVSEKLGLRVAANHSERDGFDSTEGGRVETNEGKAKLLYQPTDSLKVMVGAAFQDNETHNGGVISNLVAPNTIQYTDSRVGSGENKFRQYWGRVDWDIGGAVLTYLPALRTWEQDARLYVFGPGGGLLTQKLETPKDDFITHELRLASDRDGGFRWQGGAFYYDNDITTSNTIQWDQSGALVAESAVNRRTQDWGVFGEGTLPIGEKLRVTAGLRYDRTKVVTAETFATNINLLSGSGPTAGLPEFVVRASVTGDEGTRTFDNVTYKARVEYDLTAQNLLYGGVSSGFLPGDVQISTGAGNLPVVNTYEAEDLTAVEFGSKNRFFNNSLQVNASVFHYNYGGYQTTITADPTNPASARLVSVPLKTQGAEVEVLYQLAAKDRIGLNASYVQSEFQDEPVGFKDAVAQSKLWGFPPKNATVFYEHAFELGGSNLLVRGEANYRSGYYSSSVSAALAAQGALRYAYVDSVVLAHLNATWTSPDGKYGVTGYVRNITDERYKTGVQVQSISPLIATSNLSQPRTYGVILTAHF